MSTVAAAGDIDTLRKAWKEANLAPLWENKFAHRPPPPPEATYVWAWEKIRPLITGAIKVASPEAIERRVLQLVPPQRIEEEGQQTSKTLAANIQILLPGEKARPHRHTMNALRFVLEGSGAITIVDGKPCPMEEGDLVLTPAWTWHEHVHQGAAPIMWLDALDVPLHHYMGTGAFQPGPVDEMPETVADAAFAVANVVPDTSYATKDYSPVFRYPYATASAAVAAAPPARDGSRRVRYINPLTGGTGDGADRLLPGAARCRHDHAAVPHQRQLGLLRGGGLRRKPGRQRDDPVEEARHFHVAARQPHRPQQQRRHRPPVPGLRPRHLCAARAAQGRIRQHRRLSGRSLRHEASVTVP